ncbi:GIY-YIG nuclease family protein [Enterovibrio norvegicus]|uniref:GIY-YIG nuclease family protein n=1 Tax=Enterovibrio norvegicus TaxID=188144 RepID=UPI0013D18E46|nr:GIY-YIG nuclease family protein [Enterovibrio norvegicus]
MDKNDIITLIIIFLPWVLLIITKRNGKNKCNELERKLAKSKEDIEYFCDLKQKKENENHDLKKKYSPIIDIENHAEKLIGAAEEKAEEINQEAERIFSSAREIRTEAKSNAETIKNNALAQAKKIEEEAKCLRLDANLKLKEAKERSETIKLDAREEARKVVEYAEGQAKEIAGDAIEAKAKADTYEKAIRAMRNTIEGYKDDYIIPNHSVLDDLAEEFSHKDAGEELKAARSRVREMVKDGYAGTCDYVEAHRKTYAIHFAVDAFNGKVDSALAKVKHDNFGKIKQEIIDAFALVNHNGAPFRNARIRQEFLDTRLKELGWAVAAFELKKIEREEQAAIKAQIREEEKVIREMEKARKEAEKEERILQKALEKARKELESANEEQRAQFESQLAELEIKLQEAEEKGQRAISMAQQTKRGHVYVISNIGSFGENVFKIGMTRRLEPMDRVKELGDASVPFSFDVHAMIYSNDAPALEKALHSQFNLQAVNKVNSRKEFFNTSVAEIKKAVEQSGIHEVHWTLKAEAAEYRESLAIKHELQEQNQPSTESVLELTI